MILVEAVYQDGVLRPLKPLPLRSGERVHIIVRRRSDPARWDMGRFAALDSEEERDLGSSGLEDCARSLNSDDDRRSE